MTDPIGEAESAVEALASFEQLAAATKNGVIRLEVADGRVVSASMTSVLKAADVPGAAPIAAIADELRYGAVEFEVIDGRIVDWVALPRRRIA